MLLSRPTRGLAAAIGLMAIGGCATTPPMVVVIPQTQPPAAPAEVAEAPEAQVAAAAPAPAPSPCGELIAGWSSLIAPGRVVLLGEVHGSNEIPTFLADAACQAAEAGLAVHIALEIAEHEQPMVDAYLESEGTPEDRGRLLGSGMWHRAYEDGRSSVAVAEVIERARVLRRSGRAIDVLYYDQALRPGSSKERQLAGTIVEAWQKAPQDLFLVLTGNAHARTAVGVEWDKKHQPMGFHLAASLPDVLVLDAQYTGGQAWRCELSRLGYQVKCGVRRAVPPQRKIREAGPPMLADGRRASRYVGTFEQPSPEGFHGIYFVGTLSAAAPAGADEGSRSGR